jgi:hypothetical protein
MRDCDGRFPGVAEPGKVASNKDTKPSPGG